MADGDMPPLPPLLEYTEHGSGAPTLSGRSSRYEKRISELTGLYRDTAAYDAIVAEDPERLVYWVDESRSGTQSGALIVGMSALAPGRVGTEFAMTRGHLHAKADCAEYYHCVTGLGVLLMDDLHGRTSAAELTPGRGVHVPGGWVHRSVNVGAGPFVTLFAYDADAGQDYGIIAAAGGMRELVVADGDGWATVPNPDHRGYAIRSEDA